MKLIIDIPEEAYKKLLEEQHLPKDLDVEYLIMNGTPLEEEFENIKAEIRGRCIFSISKIDVLDIIDNRIAELKGK